MASERHWQNYVPIFPPLNNWLPSRSSTHTSTSNAFLCAVICTSRPANRTECDCRALGMPHSALSSALKELSSALHQQQDRQQTDGLKSMKPAASPVKTSKVITLLELVKLLPAVGPMDSRAIAFCPATLPPADGEAVPALSSSQSRASGKDPSPASYHDVSNVLPAVLRLLAGYLLDPDGAVIEATQRALR